MHLRCFFYFSRRKGKVCCFDDAVVVFSQNCCLLLLQSVSISDFHTENFQANSGWSFPTVINSRATIVTGETRLDVCEQKTAIFLHKSSIDFTSIWKCPCEAGFCRVGIYGNCHGDIEESRVSFKLLHNSLNWGQGGFDCQNKQTNEKKRRNKWDRNKVTNVVDWQKRMAIADKFWRQFLYIFPVGQTKVSLCSSGTTKNMTMDHFRDYSLMGDRNHSQTRLTSQRFLLNPDQVARVIYVSLSLSLSLPFSLSLSPAAFFCLKKCEESNKARCCAPSLCHFFLPR